MLLLLMATLVKVETSASSQQLIQLQARQNALLGVMIAIGELQKHAGPDQRVTARADILGDDVAEGARFWTGVWDSSNPSAPPIWLVSGENPDPESESADMEITDKSIINILNSDKSLRPLSLNPVNATLVNIPSGRLAWWISDEGVKASIGLGLEPKAPISTTQQNIYFRKWDSYFNPANQGFDPRQGSSLRPPFYEQNRQLWDNLLSQVTSARQLRLLGEPFDEPEMDFSFDYTLNATGLLTNPTDGGFKIDLSSDQQSLGPAVESFLDYENYMIQPSASAFLVNDFTDQRRVYRVVSPPSPLPPTGEFIHSVAPILTDFGIQFALRPISANSRSLQLAVRSVAEMWNPYSSALLPEEWILELTGIEPVVFTLYDEDESPVESIQVDIHQILGDPIIFRLEFENTTSKPGYDLDANSYDLNLFGPGRIVRWITPNENVTGNRENMTFGNSNAGNATIYVDLSKQLTNPANSEFYKGGLGVEGNASTLKLLLRRSNENGGQLLAKWHDDDEGGTNSGLEFSSFDSDPQQRTLTGWTTSFVGFQIRLRETGHSFITDQALWLKENDPRNHRPTFGESGSPVYVPSEGSTTTTGSIQDGLNPASFKNTLSLAQEQGRYFTERPLSSGQHSITKLTNAPLFELLRRPPISLAQLQHMQVTGFPPYSVGNSWGGTLNTIFDSHFFSSVSSDQWQDGLWVNNRYKVIPNFAFDSNDLPQDLVSSRLEVQGSFNINSTSVAAWRSVLRSNRLSDFEFIEWDTDLTSGNNIIATQLISTNTDSLQSHPPIFFRFPQSFQEHFGRNFRDYYNPFSGPTSFRRYPSQVFQQGFRFLSSRSGTNNNVADYRSEDDLSQLLAEAIVKRIKELGRPFVSMNEFLGPLNGHDSKSLLEEAIASIPELSESKTQAGSVAVANIPIPERFPAHLSQADILTTLSPVVNVRSDTFSIRAYGESVTPLSDNVLARSALEVTVKRVVEPASVTSSQTAAEYLDSLRNPDAFGRKFIITSFKWID